jgi:excisionase family DNA binding protein
MLGTAASIDVERLLQLVTMIRLDKTMPVAVRRLNVDKLLMAVDIIRRCEVEKLISIMQAAKLRGVSRQSIWKMVRSGTLTGYKVAGHTVIDRDELLGLPPKGELRLATLTFKHMRKCRES